MEINKNLFLFSVKDIVEIGCFTAIAIILDQFIKIPIQVSGSVNIACLPLFIIAIRKGPFKSFLASGVVFGLLTCIFDGSNILSFVLDYLLGFGGVCFAGFFRKQISENITNNPTKSVLYIVISISLFTINRIIFSCISGMVIYGLSLIPSFVYQLTYIIPSSLIVSILLIALLKPLKRVLTSEN